jgi:putative restriction endonuclease
LEAAHIIPVRSPESNDLTSNGLVLCHLHHEAYDSALLGIDEDYRTVLNEGALRRLDAKKRLYGLDDFTEALRPEIRLPTSQVNRPRPEYLRRAMELRGWA